MDDFTSASSISLSLSPSSYPINFDFDHLVHFQVSDFQYTWSATAIFVCKKPKIEVRRPKKSRNTFLSAAPIDQKRKQNKTKQSDSIEERVRSLGFFIRCSIRTVWRVRSVYELSGKTKTQSNNNCTYKHFLCACVWFFSRSSSIYQ